MNQVFKAAKGPVLPLVLIVASCAAWTVLRIDRPAHSSEAADKGVFFVSPLEETASETIPDWASQADVVVKASVVSEAHPPPVDSETVGQPGMELVGRTVTLQVSGVIWQSPSMTRPDPTTFSVEAYGWMQADDGTEREVATEGTSRLEVGHQYVLALIWREAECSPGDPTVPAHWSVLGSGAALPADGNTIGVGEFQGTPTDLVDTSSGPEPAPGTALAEFAGDRPAELSPALDKAVDAQPEADTSDPGSCTP
jgi:hypothetical protein